MQNAAQEIGTGRGGIAAERPGTLTIPKRRKKPDDTATHPRDVAGCLAVLTAPSLPTGDMTAERVLEIIKRLGWSRRQFGLQAQIGSSQTRSVIRGEAAPQPWIRDFLETLMYAAERTAMPIGLLWLYDDYREEVRARLDQVQSLDDGSPALSQHETAAVMAFYDMHPQPKFPPGWNAEGPSNVKHTFRALGDQLGVFRAFALSVMHAHPREWDQLQDRARSLCSSERDVERSTID